LEDRKYFLISMLVILESLLPFAFIFENRKPKARELIVIAVLTALVVSGRAAFFFVPAFKPVLALIIISAVAMGGEAGFFVGALSMFTSNMIFGQGPWTPWQMFAAGIVGFIAGVLFKKGILRSKRVPLAIFGFLITMIVYGGIMNPASVLMYQENPNMEMILAAYAMGIPYDLVHAGGTFIFLLLLSEPMLEKLERLKQKYEI